MGTNEDGVLGSFNGTELVYRKQSIPHPEKRFFN